MENVCRNTDYSNEDKYVVSHRVRAVRAGDTRKPVDSVRSVEEKDIGSQISTTPATKSAP